MSRSKEHVFAFSNRDIVNFFDMVLGANVDYMDSLEEDKRPFCAPVLSHRTEALYIRYHALYSVVEHFGLEEAYASFVKLNAGCPLGGVDCQCSPGRVPG